MDSSAQTFSERMLPHLEALARRMLDNRDFAYLSTIASLMDGLHRGGWSKLPKDDKEYYLTKLDFDFHPKGMGDSEYGADPHYRSILELLSSEARAVRSQ